MDDLLEQLKNYYQQYKYFLWPIISGVSSILILALVIVPQVLSYVNTGNEIQVTLADISSLEVKAQDLEKVNEDQYKKDLDVLFKVLPADSNVPGAVASVQEIIKKSNLNYKGVNYTGSNEKSSNKFILTFQATGNLESIRNFISNIKKYPGVYQIESLNLVFKKEESTYGLDIPIAVFYEAVPSFKVDLNTPAPKLSEAEINKLADYQRLVPQTGSLSSTQPGTAKTPVISTGIGKADPFE